MAAEVSVQQKIIKYLKSKGCFVIKTHPQPGTPVGTPDIIFMKEGFWGAIECKASATAKWQPLQQETLEKFAKWSWARKLYPENLDDIIAELNKLL